MNECQISDMFEMIYSIRMFRCWHYTIAVEHEFNCMSIVHGPDSYQKYTTKVYEVVNIFEIIKIDHHSCLLINYF